MADKARDLQFRVLSDLSKLDLDKPARDLDQLGDAGKRSLDSIGDGLDDASRAARDFADDARDAGRQAGRSFDDTADDVKATGKATRDFADDARDTARRVARAFDDISDASNKSKKHIGDDLDESKRGLQDFKDEAHGSGREAAASFSGGFDDIIGFVQETAANALGGFGPLGAAAGIAAAAGIGVITKVFSDSKERAEELKQNVADVFDALVEGAGKVQEASINSKLQEMFGDPDRYKRISTDAREAGVGIELYARALAGDAKAAKEVSERVRELSAGIDGNNHRTTESEAATLRQANALKRMSGELGISSDTMSAAESAWRDLDRATRAGITADVTVDAPTARELRNEHALMKGELGKPVTVPVKVDALTAARIAHLEADRYFRNHPITIRTKAGARPVRDVP